MKKFIDRSFGWKTIDANTGRVEEPVAKVHRPSGFLLRAFTFVFALTVALIFGGAMAQAQTDITDTLTTVTGYVTGGIGIGVTVMLFVIGRAVVRKLAK